MSATPNALRDPRLLPGISAFGLTRLFLLIYLLGLVAWAPFVYLLLVSGGENGTPTVGSFVGIAFVVIGASLVTRFIGGLRNLRERQAGYTTLLNNPLDRDLLDRHTGVVLWRAGDPAPRRPGLMGIIRGDQGGPAPTRGVADSAFPAPTVISRIVPFLPFAASIAALAVGVSIARVKISPVGVVLFYLGAGAFAALVLGVVVLVTRLTLGRRIQAIAALRPNAMIFTSTRSRALATAANELGIRTSASGRFPIVAAESAIEFWGSNRSFPWMSLPWSEIVSVQPGSAPVGQNTFRAVTLVVERDARKVSITLALYGRQGTFNAPVAWANQIFDEIRFHVRKD
jgi:hypothetical protein